MNRQRRELFVEYGWRFDGETGNRIESLFAGTLAGTLSLR